MRKSCSGQSVVSTMYRTRRYASSPIVTGDAEYGLQNPFNVGDGPRRTLLDRLDRCGHRAGRYCGRGAPTSRRRRARMSVPLTFFPEYTRFENRAADEVSFEAEIDEL
jgi:hypothetical protein